MCQSRLTHCRLPPFPWIEAEFGMSDDTARNFMRVAEVYGDNFRTVRDLPPTALYELAATPPEVREEVGRMIHCRPDRETVKPSW